MSQTEEFISKLEGLKEGERAHLRRLSGQPLDRTLQGFDLFTGLWWPLRRQSPIAPRRETSWLIAKLHGAFPIPHVRPESKPDRPTVAWLLGWLEPRDKHSRLRFRKRFDNLLSSPLPTLEPHLLWALSEIAEAVDRKEFLGLDWVQLLDDLSIWDRGEQHRRVRDIRDIWAEQYLKATNHMKGA